MKILELTNFSAGICGVWARVREEAERLSKKHEVVVFSSNFVKGNGDVRAKPEDRIGKVEIKRFKARKLGGESYMKWDFESVKSAVLEFKPDVIIAHSYRHKHTDFALDIGEKIGAKVFLVTHAPFVENDKTRSLLARIYLRFYYKKVVLKNIKKFNKVIAITKWEIPILEKLGVDKRKIEYIPNGIPELFFSQKKEKEENKILFLGRVAPVKNIETAIKAMRLVEDKKIKLEIVGPAEKDYLKKLTKLVKKHRLESRIVFSEGIFEIKEKIRKIDSCKIFVLPSKSEAMPQSLIEAMAREKIVIASDNKGAKELVENGKTGHLFRIGNSKELAGKINKVLSAKESEKIGDNAKKFVSQFSWDKIIKKIEGLI
ncbi:hypothetical protein CMI45_00710 [Candidatus Pacearchaeota archaeon]|nr:hypothetical protein [Candidatus Pacearchaeota archaeon]